MSPLRAKSAAFFPEIWRFYARLAFFSPFMVDLKSSAKELAKIWRRRGGILRKTVGRSNISAPPLSDPRRLQTGDQVIIRGDQVNPDPAAAGPAVCTWPAPRARSRLAEERVGSRTVHAYSPGTAVHSGAEQRISRCTHIGSILPHVPRLRISIHAHLLPPPSMCRNVCLSHTAPEREGHGGQARRL